MRTVPLACVVACFAVACALPAPSEGSPGEGAGALVGGNLETRYPAAGYLVAKITKGEHAGELVRPMCGATLIAEKAVLTSAMCVEEQFTDDRTIIAVGFGDPLTGRTYELAGSWRDWIAPGFFGTP